LNTKKIAPDLMENILSKADKARYGHVAKIASIRAVRV